MNAEEFLRSKGIDTLTVQGFKTANINGSQTFFSAFQILEEYASKKVEEELIAFMAQMTENDFDEIRIKNFEGIAKEYLSD